MLDRSTVLDIFDLPIIECPSHCKALQAVATIQRFIAEMDGPFARKLENLLVMFGPETQLEVTHSMKTTSITDFFTCKA